ncbi:hypothetical protein SAMN05216302_10951 [Nitrosomonas aestuarii]|uniref:Uncharacterized protein n=1 Tax=Nitrosomonas aestuarii TaxID=52441 RepID=A0A1I4HNN8_9PROT|nr:hypothetical protein [Nitrosomonas aestuarii]SFL43908.1 hypothetical protein SAMN05216302_10951 [Nitrosomonas aestuarii]
MLKFKKFVLLLAITLLSMHHVMAEEMPTFTTGLAQTVNPGLYACSGANARISAVGKIKAKDGTEWIVPANTHFESAVKAADLYNQCNEIRLRRSADIDFKSVPVIDAGGSNIFTAYIFADNYFELYVNGKLLAVDPVPFTPFNSSVIRFKATRPFTLALMGVDWEENLGLGSEQNRGYAYHPGDAGLVAVIKDESGQTVAVTDKTWRAQTFYIAPLNDRSCLKVRGPVRDSSACSMESVQDGSSFSAAHWRVPASWFSPDFDDSDWPHATVFTNDTVGVNNKPAYMNFRNVFDDPIVDADFIWSSNLILDNLVLMRKVVE